MKADEFKRLTSSARIQTRTLRALRGVLVDGKLWREACADAGVPESTLLRAKRRLFGDRMEVKRGSKINLQPGQAFTTDLPRKYAMEIGAIIDASGQVIKRIIIKGDQ